MVLSLCVLCLVFVVLFTLVPVLFVFLQIVAVLGLVFLFFISAGAGEEMKNRETRAGGTGVGYGNFRF